MGQAEDIGHSARWLAERGVDWGSSLLRLLRDEELLICLAGSARLADDAFSPTDPIRCAPLWTVPLLAISSRASGRAVTAYWPTLRACVAQTAACRWTARPRSSAISYRPPGSKWDARGRSRFRLLRDFGAVMCLVKPGPRSMLSSFAPMCRTPPVRAMPARVPGSLTAIKRVRRLLTNSICDSGDFRVQSAVHLDSTGLGSSGTSGSFARPGQTWPGSLAKTSQARNSVCESPAGTRLSVERQKELARPRRTTVRAREGACIDSEHGASRGRRQHLDHESDPNPFCTRRKGPCCRRGRAKDRWSDGLRDQVPSREESACLRGRVSSPRSWRRRWSSGRWKTRCRPRRPARKELPDWCQRPA